MSLRASDASVSTLAAADAPASAESTALAARFRTVLDNIPVLIWTARPEGAADFFNRQWLAYTGLRLDQALGWGWTCVLHAEDRERVLAYWQSIRDSGEHAEIDTRMRRWDGEYRWFLIRANALRDAEGNILQWCGANTEIEDQRRAEQQVRASEESFRLIVDTLPGLVFTTTAEGEVEFVNPTLLQYFSRSLDELQGWKTSDSVHPDDLLDTYSRWQRGVASGVGYDFEQRLRRADGVYRWFHFRAEPLRDAHGRITRWYGLLTDIDDLKRAEQIAQTNERELRQLIDRVPGLVYTMTPGCDLDMVNQQVLEYFGRTFEELQRWDLIGCVHPQDLPRVLESLRRTVELGIPHEVEQRLRRADGTYRWFKPRALPLRDANGQILRWYCLLTDIDDLKRAEEGLRRVQARLSRAVQLATVSEFAATTAHEINQPLAAVIANAHACRRWLGADPPNLGRAIRSADRIIRDGNAAAEVIRRIRSLFKHAPVRKAPLTIEEVIDDVCELMGDELRGRGITLELNVATGRQSVQADRVQLQQVLTNLVRNAIEAMEHDADRPKVLAIHARHDHDEIVVEVIDQGEGLSEPDSLFESFHTTKANGMGMGLAICRSIIEAHGGRIWAESNPACGATFGFALHAGPQQ